MQQTVDFIRKKKILKPYFEIHVRQTSPHRKRDVALKGSSIETEERS